MVQCDNSLHQRLRNLGSALFMLPGGVYTALRVVHENHTARHKHSDQTLPAWRAYALDPLSMLGIFWGLFLICTPLCLVRLFSASRDE